MTMSLMTINGQTRRGIVLLYTRIKKKYFLWKPTIFSGEKIYI